MFQLPDTLRPVGGEGSRPSWNNSTPALITRLLAAALPASNSLLCNTQFRTVAVSAPICEMLFPLVTHPLSPCQMTVVMDTHASESTVVVNHWPVSTIRWYPALVVSRLRP